MGCLWCGKYNRQCKTMQSRSPLFSKVTGLKCSYRKIFSPLTAMPVRKTEISGTEQACPLIRTHRKFHKGFWGTARSLKPGSCEEALSKGVAEKNKFSNWLVIDPKILPCFLHFQLKREKSPSGRNDQHSERETRVTVDQGQGTMGRRKRRRACFLFPAFLCAQLFIELERGVWVRGRLRQVSGHSLLSRPRED